MTDLSVLKEAREIIRTQPMSLAVGHLRQCADELYEAYDVLKITCTRNAVTRFVASFNRTLLAIEMVQGNEPPAPRGGVMPLPVQEVMGC
jgi:hypothetical protein